MIPIFLTNSDNPSITYDKALNTNTTRLTGQKKDDAAFLVALKDKALLAQLLAGLASDTIKRRSISGFVKKVLSQYENFNLTLDIFVINDGIQLPTQLSEESQQTFEYLSEIEDIKVFEKKFVEYLYNTLYSIHQLIEDYLQQNYNPILFNLIANHLEIIKDQMKNTSLFIQRLKRPIQTKKGDILPPL